MALTTSVLRLDPGAVHPREVERAIDARARALGAVLAGVASQSDRVADAAAILVEAIAAEHQVLACGNGGSAAEAQHLVGELVGRFLLEREPWPAIALTTDSSVLTSIANDYGYETVFARQVAAFGRPGDVLVAFSTSGSSPSVLNAAREAHDRGMQVIALTGREPTPLGQLADVDLAVPATETPLIQEIHTVLVHLVSEVVESRLVSMQSLRKDAHR